ncbi:error-prone DNA polymerase [Paraglaciecola hydrolytica]|uniref:Error-prone DNA polymerase n=1 Tax=Paraglaciecola hydrolytica TaxID=1799789 RepID=A0A136A566_9ALTE|nr:error-prone DNA polymerase [Paraglaciecola hydrolytica]KXI30373.1 DNA polymerase [Paraglaciecola hydrolytica]
MKYAELFSQSHFSFLSGASSPAELVLQAEFLRYRAIAITDECSVAGVVRAHTAIRDNSLNIKLIVGSYFTLDDELEVVLLCPNRKAYAELCRIITNARRRAEKGQYVLNEWDLMTAKHCLLIWLPSLQDGDMHWAEWLKKYHASRLWIGLRRYLDSTDKARMQQCQALAQQYGIPLTACGGVLMHNADTLPLQHALTAIKHNTSIQQVKGSLLTNAERTLRTKIKLQKLFASEVLNESVRIASLCQFNLDELQYEYPSELVPEGDNAMGYLRHLVGAGQTLRFPDGVSEDIQALINKELQLIEELNYPYFFLTIYDVVQFAKSKGILYQGRGSAANSVVCYCLEITSVDPRQISVLFERFISKERNEPPDIDVDFEHERREEIIQYIYSKYGRERAALAATVICYRFKSAVRDVGKALGISESQVEYFIKNVNRRDRSLGWQAQVVELGLQPDSQGGLHFIRLVNDLMGCPRHLSQHVGGFIISAGPLYELVPIENAAMNERTVIQWDKDDLESLGLLKVDVLALGMLTAIRKCFSLIEKHNNQSLSIADITRKQDDAKVYDMIQKADTVGMFQIESRAQMSMLPRLKPACYYDLVIQIAIVRPGPIQGDMVHPYLKRRAGIEAVTYPSKAVESVLSRTLGVPIFQEQVIKLAMVAAGFTGGEADQLRRAMAAWKKSGAVFKFKDKLINGMTERGYKPDFAERIFQQICGFGEYGFPESHSASFAVLAYVSAWLKHYYPAAFYTALLNSLPMGFYSPSQLIQDAKRHGISVLPICVNHSQVEHVLISGHEIRLGFRLVKGLSNKAMHTLVSSRPLEGYSQASQIKSLGINRKDIEALASANALHRFSGDRYQTRWQMMDNISDLPLFANNVTEESPFNYQPTDTENLLEDYISTGLTLGEHPIQILNKAEKLPRFLRANQLTQKNHKSLVTVIGVVTGKQAPGTASGVTFITLEDDTGNINVVVWAGTSRAQKQAYLTAKILQVDGILEREGDVIHIIAGRLTDLSHKLAELSTHSRDFH